MKKNFEQKNDSEQPHPQETDVFAILRKIQQHLVFLERKIDTLMGRSPAGSFNKRQQHPQRYRQPGHERWPANQERQYDKPRENEERNFNRKFDSEGERSFRGRGRFSHRHRGPKRHF